MNTPEQVEAFQRIDSIFAPAYWRQMNTFYAKQSDPTKTRFVHYTSAEAALKIIKQKRIWMRNVTAMSDYSEVQHGRRLYAKLLGNPVNAKPFIEALDRISPGTAREAVGLFDSRWNDISFNTFITSVSEHDESEDVHGRLSMWRAFGGQTARVALVFTVRRSLLNAGVLSLVFSPVAYLTEPELTQHFEEIVRGIDENSEFLRTIEGPTLRHIVFNALANSVICLKHRALRRSVSGD